MSDSSAYKDDMADLITSGIAGLQLAAQQEVGEAPVAFSANDCAIQTAMTVQVAPLDQNAPFDMTVDPTADMPMAEQVAAALRAIKNADTPASNRDPKKPSL